LSIRGRLRVPGAWLIALLAVALVAPGSAFAGGSGSTGVSAPTAEKQQPIPEPREQQPGETAGFRLPFASGMDVRIEQGWNTAFSHNGKAAYAYDFGLYLDTPVLAAADGVVAYVHDGETACGGPELLRNVNYVVINHADGSATQYGHLTSTSVDVGDVVTAGQLIGKSGNTGYSHCFPHLHFARQYQGGPVTESVPVYFEGYADKEFHSGDIVKAQAAKPCPAPNEEGAVSGESLLGAYCGSYFAGAFDGPATFARRDAVLNFDWHGHGPGGYWLDDAGLGFSARWSGRFVFASSGTYTIGVIASGAVIVSIDGVPVVDRWVDLGRPIETLVSRRLGAGIHQVDVEYLSTAGHGLLKVGWGRLFADG
jgi:murein DD-endopeptidase MepM/ murein hydrolase activator NlpD